MKGRTNTAKEFIQLAPGAQVDTGFQDVNKPVTKFLNGNFKARKPNYIPP